MWALDRFFFHKIFCLKYKICDEKIDIQSIFKKLESSSYNACLMVVFRTYLLKNTFNVEIKFFKLFLNDVFYFNLFLIN